LVVVCIKGIKTKIRKHKVSVYKMPPSEKGGILKFRTSFNLNGQLYFFPSLLYQIIPPFHY